MLVEVVVVIEVMVVEEVVEGVVEVMVVEVVMLMVEVEVVEVMMMMKILCFWIDLDFLDDVVNVWIIF